jgi:hypothetical protein
MHADVNPVRPGAGERDAAFAAAMRRAEATSMPRPSEPHPLDAVGRTRTGRVVRRNGDHFIPGPLLDTSSLPLLD